MIWPFHRPRKEGDAPTWRQWLLWAACFLFGVGLFYLALFMGVECG